MGASGRVTLRAADIAWTSSTAPASARFTFLGLRDLMNAPKPAALFAQPLAVSGGLTGLVGSPGDGKTMLLCNMALALLTGRPVHGLVPLEQGAVLYLDGERSLGLRLQAAAHAAGIALTDSLPLIGLAGEALDLSDTDSTRAFINAALLADVRPVMLAVDTWPLYFGGDENGPDMNIGVRNVQAIRDALGTATVAVLHPTKADATIERGHSSFRGAADYMLGTKRVGDRVTLSTTKNRFGPAGQIIGSYRICAVPEVERGACLRPAADVIDDETLSTRDVTAWGALTDGMTHTAWREAAEAAGLTRSQFNAAMTRLVDLGRAVKNGSAYVRG